MQFVAKMSRYLAPVGMGAMLIMTVVITLNVLGRALFNLPIFGALEIVQLTGVITLSFFFAYTQYRKDNIYIGLAVDKMKPGLRKGFDVFSMLISLIFVGMMTWTSTAFASKFPKETTYIFELPTRPFRIIFIIGCFSMFVVLAGQFIESVAKAVKK